MVYSDYCLIDIRFLFTFYVWMVSSTYLGPRHIHLSFHFCFKFSSVFSYVSKILVSFISPRHPVKQSLKKRKDFRRRPPCGCSPPPQCVAPSCLRLPPARKPPSPPWPSARPTCCRSTCKTSQCPSNSAAASPSGQP